MQRIFDEPPDQGFNWQSVKNCVYFSYLICPFIFLLVVLIISCCMLNLMKVVENEDSVFQAFNGLNIFNIFLCMLGVVLSLVLFCSCLGVYRKFYIYIYVGLIFICFLVLVTSYTEVGITWNLKPDGNESLSLKNKRLPFANKKLVGSNNEGEVNLNQHDKQFSRANDKGYYLRNVYIQEHENLALKRKKDYISESKNKENSNSKQKNHFRAGLGDFPSAQNDFQKVVALKLNKSFSQNSAKTKLKSFNIHKKFDNGFNDSFDFEVKILFVWSLLSIILFLLNTCLCCFSKCA